MPAEQLLQLRDAGAAGARTVGDSAQSIAIVGATGVVGQEALRILADLAIPAAQIRALASERSAGGVIRYAGAELPIRALAPAVLIGCFHCEIAIGSPPSVGTMETSGLVARFDTRSSARRSGRGSRCIATTVDCPSRSRTRGGTG